MIVLASFAIFFAACAGIVFFTVQAIRFLGQALNKRRPQPSRLRSGLISAAAAAAIVLSGAGGFLGISSVWFYAQKPGSAQGARP